MARVALIFEWVFNVEPAREVELQYVRVANVGMSPEVVAAREEKERQAMGSLEVAASRLDSLAQLHEFINVQHGAYAAERLPSNIDDGIRESY
jgi:hypothetical protein